MKLHCEFSFNQKTLVYKCTVSKISGELNNKLHLVGTHVNDKSMKDVTAIQIQCIELKTFPSYLAAINPLIEILSINSCGIEQVSKYDLIGFKNLKQLSLNGNELTILPEDLFEYSPKLEYLSLYGNRIEQIGTNLLQPLRNIEYVNLKMNTNIDECYKRGNEFQTLDEMETIFDTKFNRNRTEIIPQNFGETQRTENSKSTFEEVMKMLFYIVLLIIYVYNCLCFE